MKTVCIPLALALSCGFLQAKPSPATATTLPPAFGKSVPESLEDLRAMESHLQDVVRRVSPAVVAVRAGSSVGSAVIISEDGLVLCAAHVCGMPGRPVRFWFPNGRSARGVTLGTNHGIDAGLMKITDSGPWPFVPIAEPDRVRIGDWAVALGHPDGFDSKRPEVVRLGRVSRLAGLMQTDCALISGDSGGPLFDMHGHVIGIHSRISDSLGGNFHVPIGTYLETWDRLVNGENWGNEGPPPRPTIGVRAIDSPEGCVLERVNENGPGDSAGLRPGDIVLRVNGKPVTEAADLATRVRQSKAGDELALLVQRAGESLPLKVKVEERRGRGGRPRPQP